MPPRSGLVALIKFKSLETPTDRQAKAVVNGLRKVVGWADGDHGSVHATAQALANTCIVCMDENNPAGAMPSVACMSRTGCRQRVHVECILQTPPGYVVRCSCGSHFTTIRSFKVCIIGTSWGQIFYAFLLSTTVCLSALAIFGMKGIYLLTCMLCLRIIYDIISYVC